MKAVRSISLVLASAVLAAQPVLACLCLEDCPTHAHAAVAEDRSCSGSHEARHGESRPGESGQCGDCGDYEPASALRAVEAAASSHLPEFNAAPAVAGHAAIAAGPQALRSIGPPPAIPRVARTPVLLKQRLLI